MEVVAFVLWLEEEEDDEVEVVEGEFKALEVVENEEEEEVVVVVVVEDEERFDSGEGA